MPEENTSVLLALSRSTVQLVAHTQIFLFLRSISMCAVHKWALLELIRWCRKMNERHFRGVYL